MGLFVSHPFRSRLRNGNLSIGLTRRINGPDGAFAGVALLAIRIEYFQRLLDKISTGKSGAVFIVLDDGTLLARKPLPEREIGTSIAKSPTFLMMAARKDVIEMDMSVDQALKFVISLGVVQPADRKAARKKQLASK